MPEISVERLNWRKWPEFASEWERIHSACPDASFFVSREWVHCWLATFGKQLSPELLRFSHNGSSVGCCLLVRRTQLVRGIPLRRIYLNCAGEDENDSTCIEFNSLLSLPGYGEVVAKSLKTLLKSLYWDELVLPGLIEEEPFQALATSFGREELAEIPARFIDFSKIRASRKDFMNFLGSKTRAHIRRTQRAYEEVGGSCTAHVAQNVDEALTMLRELAELHQARWEARGSPGSFSSPKFIDFHQNLIRQAFARCLFFRLQAGDKIVGLLYCFVHKGWIYHYQSGFCYTLDRRSSPGLLTLYFLISYCLERDDLKGFDFMAGDSEYKRSLTAPADHRILRWYIIRRYTPSTLIFLSFRELKKNYAQIFKKSRQPMQPHIRSESDRDAPLSNNDIEQMGGH